MTHNRDVWMQDRRPIHSAVLGHGQAGRFLTSHPALDGQIGADRCGWTFERFERNGHMAMIPYLRATKEGATLEAPLENWESVAFGEDPVE
jgi:hypothetical protein